MLGTQQTPTYIQFTRRATDPTNCPTSLPQLHADTSNTLNLAHKTILHAAARASRTIQTSNITTANWNSTPILTRSNRTKYTALEKHSWNDRKPGKRRWRMYDRKSSFMFCCECELSPMTLYDTIRSDMRRIRNLTPCTSQLPHPHQLWLTLSAKDVDGVSRPGKMQGAPSIPRYGMCPLTQSR